MGRKWKKFTFALISACILTSGVTASGAETEQPDRKTRWENLLDRFRNEEDTDRLIFVKYQGGSDAALTMYKKEKKGAGYIWKKVLDCPAYTGQNGIDKTAEGDRKTPTGTYWITGAFGMKENPGTDLPYTKLNQYLYWSEERDTYNQMVDSRKVGWVTGEHLIEHSPQYHYALVIGYNRECVYQKGSAIFLHVNGSNPYTAGCVAVSESSMKKIMKNTTEHTRICIYPY